MKTTGVVRRIDELGRIVVPKEMRRTLRIREGDSLEISSDNESIVLKKYSLVESVDNFITQYVEAVHQSSKKEIIEELKNRDNLKLDPIYEVNRIFIKAEYKEMYKTANEIRRSLYDLIKYNVQILGPAYNRTEKAVSLIVKHQSKRINEIYNDIYKKYQNSKVMILFDKYPKNL